MAVSCSSLKRLPDDMILTLVQRLDSPSVSDCWSKFNKLHRYYKKLEENTDNVNGLLCNDDLPLEPKVINFPICDDS